MAQTVDIGRSALRVFKHYKKHYDDINTLFGITGLDVPASPSLASDELPEDLLVLTEKADQSLAELKKHTHNVDQLAAIKAENLQTQKPELCTALTNYKKDLDTLFAAIQTIRTKAPKPKRKKATGKARTRKF